jgi:hypothetical protein
MKNTSQKDEWSIEPVHFEERESLIAGLALLLQTVDRHLLELDTKWGATPNAPERIIR